MAGRFGGLSVPLRRAARKFNRWLAVPAGKSLGLPLQRAGAHRAAFIRAHLDPHSLPHLLPLSLYAGAGGARSRAISDRISANDRRGTATSASWNGTYRPGLTTFAPILISFSRRLVIDHLSSVLGIASVRMKFPRL